MAASDVLSQLQAYQAAGDFADWHISYGPQVQSNLAAAGASSEAAMVEAYLNLLPEDIDSEAYGDAADALINSVNAVTNNLNNMLNPPPPGD